MLDMDKIPTGSIVVMTDDCGSKFDCEFVCNHNGKYILYSEELCWPYYDFDPKEPDGCKLSMKGES